MLSTPALTLFSGPNDVCGPGLIAGSAAGLVCAFAEPINPSWVAATAIAAVPKKPRRCWLISSDIPMRPMGNLSASIARHVRWNEGRAACAEFPKCKPDQGMYVE